MPRSGWVKPVSDRRLSDLVAVGLLTQVFPRDLVDEVIAQTGRTEQRNRSLPARVMAYFAIGMGLSDGSYEEVMSQITDGLSWVSGWQESATPSSKSAIFQVPGWGRSRWRRCSPRSPNRLGRRRRRGLARGKAVGGGRWHLHGPAGHPPQRGLFRPRSGESGGKASFPQMRVVALAECGTYAMFEAVVGACTGSEAVLVSELIGRLQPGMLLLADRGDCSYAMWREAIGTGADLLWLSRTGLRPEHLQTLGDGSWLALIRPAGDEVSEPITVRVIDCRKGDGSNKPGSCQLITTVLDIAQASATELAAAYARRWKIELALDELKTHQSGPRTVLRSKSPELVLQEIWGHLCCHYAIRALMTGASRRAQPPIH